MASASGADIERPITPDNRPPELQIIEQLCRQVFYLEASYRNEPPHEFLQALPNYIQNLQNLLNNLSMFCPPAPFPTFPPAHAVAPQTPPLRSAVPRTPRVGTAKQLDDWALELTVLIDAAPHNLFQDPGSLKNKVALLHELAKKMFLIRSALLDPI